MEGKVTRHQLFGCFIATMGLVGCKTVPGSGCDRPEVPPQQPLRLNVTREVPARSFLAVVIDKATNQPVRQASISISELRRGAYTDTLGVALVPGLPRGAHTVSIRQIGYVPRSERIYMGMATKESEAGPPPPPEAFVAMQQYNEDSVKAGVLLAAEGLSPTSKGARVKLTGDECTVIDGPFTETKEVVAGFSIIRVNSLDDAIQWVKQAPNVFPNGEAVIEIRKLMDAEDGGEACTPNAEIAKVKY